jgi:phage tail sheath gpL-like
MGGVVREPDVDFTLVSADTVVPNAAHRILVCGSVDTATYDSAAVTTLVLMPDYEGVENTDFGVRSMLANMVREAKIANAKTKVKDDHVTAIDVMPIVDGGTKGTIILTLVGTSTALGTIDLYIGGADYKLTVTIPNAQAAAAVATLLKTAWDADEGVSGRSTNAPFTLAAPAGAVLTWTSVHGAQDPKVGFRAVTSNCPGISITTFVDGVAGATNPDLTAVFDSLTNIRYQTIVWPYNESDSETSVDDLKEASDFLDTRFNASGEVLDGVAFTAIADSVADCGTTLDLMNSKSHTIFCMKEDLTTGANDAGTVLTPFDTPYEMISRFAGIRGRRFTENHNISDIVIANAALDQRGGPGSASLPYHNTPIKSTLSFEGLGWTKSNITALEADQGSIFGENAPGNATIVGAVRTTYRNDAAGNPDPTWGFLNYIDTASQSREYMVNNVRARYSQSRLTEGALVRGREQENAASISGFIDKLYGDLSGRTYALTQSGEAALVYFKENKTVDLNLLTGTVTIFMKLPIVTQIRNVVATVQIDFSVEEG